MSTPKLLNNSDNEFLGEGSVMVAFTILVLLVKVKKIKPKL
jgi:hypothetical protein